MLDNDWMLADEENNPPQDVHRATPVEGSLFEHENGDQHSICEECGGLIKGEVDLVGDTPQMLWNHVDVDVVLSDSIEALKYVFGDRMIVIDEEPRPRDAHVSEENEEYEANVRETINLVRQNTVVPPWCAIDMNNDGTAFGPFASEEDAVNAVRTADFSHDEFGSRADVLTQAALELEGWVFRPLMDVDAWNAKDDFR